MSKVMGLETKRVFYRILHDKKSPYDVFYKVKRQLRAVNRLECDGKYVYCPINPDYAAYNDNRL
jgi:hypothetical protein